MTVLASIILFKDKAYRLTILSIIIIAVSVAAIFISAGAYMREGRYAKVGAIIMPIGLAAVAVGILLFFIPDFFSIQ